MEAEIHKTRMLYLGIAGSAAATASEAYKAYKDYMEASLPFSKNIRSLADDKMREMMKKEAQKGVITFNTMPNPLKARAAKLKQLDAETKRIYTRKGKF